MSNLITQYLKKVSEETDDSKLRNEINDIIGYEGDQGGSPSFMKSKSSFKEANKVMKGIEDKVHNTNESNE